MPDLHLHQITIVKQDLWGLCAKRSHLQVKVEDHGYHLHSYLQEAYHGGGPQPFAIVRETAAEFQLLAYSDRAHQDLPVEPNPVAPRPYHSSKPVPATIWQPGRRMRFTLRCVPTMRMSRDVYLGERNASIDGFNALLGDASSTDSEGDSKTIEVDAVEHARRTHGSQDTREVIYKRWCAEAIQRDGAFAVRSWAMEKFSIHAFLRRTQITDEHGRREVRVIKKPDLTCSGEVEVVNPEAVVPRLLVGFGRHTPFGYGMLLLRPA